MENDAYQNENQQEFPEGQLVEDNVGQDVGVESAENSQDVTEEESSRYHQSRADKLAAENEQLKKYEKVGQLLESRPDLVQNLMGQLQGSGQPQQPQNVEMRQDEFDPWEAFNDPKSKSYQYREQQDDERIDARVEQRLCGIQKQMGQSQLQNQVINDGLVTREELTQFMDFVNKHPA